MQSDEAQIDEITTQFFDAFTTRDRAVPDVDRLYRLFAAGARIVNNVGGKTQVYDVREFVEPRRAILTNGSMTDFSEWETSAKTDVFGSIAQRFSVYRKSWSVSGQQFEGEGAKSLQFIRTPEGWKISSLIWDDK